MSILGSVLYVGPPDGEGTVMVISDDAHECGWTERITYIDSSGGFVRSGCAGCEADFPRPATPAKETPDE